MGIKQNYLYRVLCPAFSEQGKDGCRRKAAAGTPWPRKLGRGILTPRRATIRAHELVAVLRSGSAPMCTGFSIDQFSTF